MAKRKKARAKRVIKFRSAPAQPKAWTTCPHCGARAPFNPARGQFLEHEMPRSMISCPGPKRFNAPRRNGRGGIVEPEKLVRERPAEKAENSSIVRTSASIRTVSGGLPTLGRRR